MGVITISRQVGSSGTKIARIVASELGLALIEKEDIEEIMQRCGFSAFEEIYNAKPSFWARFDEHRKLTIDFLCDTLRAVVKCGDVLVLGRGGFGLFQGYTDILNVRIKAPFGLRAMRKQQEYGGSEREGKKILEHVDQVRTSFVTNDLGFDLEDSASFDVVLDTGIVAPEEAAAIIINAYRYLAQNPRIDALHTRADLQVSEELAEVVKEVVAAKRTTG
ncbi:MAG TPA: cytidylate kinase family protein [Sphaerochaeta sp.]|nr:cytidylate kinase family protein [Sphaerochaeta sp.]